MPGAPSIDGWVAELVELLDAEGIERTALVAHSMGTLVANTFAARYPDRVTKVALLGAVRAQPEQAKTATRARARTVRGGGHVRRRRHHPRRGAVEAHPHRSARVGRRGP